MGFTKWRAAIAIGVVAVALCGWLAANRKRVPQYQWHPFESSDTHFRINFPGNPTLSQENTTASEGGSKFISYKVTTSPAHGIVYSLAWWENPAQKDKSNDELFAKLP